MNPTELFKITGSLKRITDLIGDITDNNYSTKNPLNCSFIDFSNIKEHIFLNNIKKEKIDGKLWKEIMI